MSILLYDVVSILPSASHVRELLGVCETLPLQPGKVHNDANDTRKCDVAFIDRSDRFDWLFRRIDGVLFDMAAKFKVNVSGSEPPMYAVYGPDGHYDWHVDMQLFTPGAQLPIVSRKLSVSVFLNDDPTTIEPVPGRAVVFPAFIPHRVTPVTRGVRKSLVIWLTGPRWR